MNKRTTLINFLALLLVLAVGLPNAQAEPPKPPVEINLQWADAGIGNLSQVDQSDALTFFQGVAHGSPGSATLTGINQGSAASVPAGDLDGCFDGADIKLVNTQLNENSVAIIFEDHSILQFGKADLGFVCIRFDPFLFQANSPIEFTGGFGRFEGATGDGRLELFAKQVIPGSDLTSAVGTITGTVEWD